MKTATKRASKTAAPTIETSRVACIDHTTWAAGDRCHQGDLILVCLGKRPTGLKALANRQLAEGDTKGSRHIVNGGKVFDGDADTLVGLIRDVTKGNVSVSDTKYIGPVFAGPCVVEHPEHQHHGFPEDSYTCVVFQRNADAEEREGRAID